GTSDPYVVLQLDSQIVKSMIKRGIMRTRKFTSSASLNGGKGGMGGTARG
ncbi:hypothetical protein Tco_0393976, partial [Tanacetum coccineum]